VSLIRRALPFALVISLPFALLLHLSHRSVGHKIAWIVATLIVALWITYTLLRDYEKRLELSSVFNEELKRKGEAEERARVYKENYEREENALKQRILDGLKAVASGESDNLADAAMSAVIELGPP
jgi:hypothetical protein